MTKKQLKEIQKIGIPSEELFHEVVDELLNYKQLTSDLGETIDKLTKNNCLLKEIKSVQDNIFNIIKEKNVNFECLQIIWVNLPSLSNEEQLKRYNGGLKRKYQLTQDEFNTLKAHFGKIIKE